MIQNLDGVAMAARKRNESFPKETTILMALSYIGGRNEEVEKRSESKDSQERSRRNAKW